MNTNIIIANKLVKLASKVLNLDVVSSKEEESLGLYTKFNWSNYVEQYANDPDVFFHFTKGVGSEKNPELKIGVRPVGAFHKDPPGIFGYPASFLKESSDKLYAFDFNYWVIFRVIRGDSGVYLNLDEKERMQSIADSNGYGNLFRFLWELKEEGNLKAGELEGLDSSIKLQKANAFWYWLVKWLANTSLQVKERDIKFKSIATAPPEVLQELSNNKWGKLVAGVDWMEDQGEEIIHPSEPNQIIVMKRSIIKVLEVGKNKTNKEFSDLYTNLKFLKSKQGQEFTKTPEFIEYLLSPTNSYALFTPYKNKDSYVHWLSTPSGQDFIRSPDFIKFIINKPLFLEQNSDFWSLTSAGQEVTKSIDLLRIWFKDKSIAFILAKFSNLFSKNWSLSETGQFITSSPAFQKWIWEEAEYTLLFFEGMFASMAWVRSPAGQVFTSTPEFFNFLNTSPHSHEWSKSFFDWIKTPAGEKYKQSENPLRAKKMEEESDIPF